MSWWDNVTKPINKAMDSNAFKAVFPVQAVANKAVQLGSGLAGIRGGEGLRPADQYAIGAGTGTILGAGSALAGSPTTGAVASPTGSPAPAGASSWENHASMLRYAPSQTAQKNQNIYDQQLQPRGRGPQAPFGPPQFPKMNEQI